MPGIESILPALIPVLGNLLGGGSDDKTGQASQNTAIPHVKDTNPYPAFFAAMANISDNGAILPSATPLDSNNPFAPSAPAQAQSSGGSMENKMDALLQEIRNLNNRIG